MFARLCAAVLVLVALAACGSDNATIDAKQASIDRCIAAGRYVTLDPTNRYAVYCTSAPVCVAPSAHAEAVARSER